MKPISPQFAAGTALSLLVAAITLPVLWPQHYLPLATFRQEWLAGTLGLLALLPLAALREGRWQFPHIGALPVGLAILLGLQAATGADIRFDTALIAALYLVWACVLMLAARRIADVLGRETMATWLARGLLAGALLLATTGALQRWAPWIGMPWIFPSAIVNGNIAQSNNFADYLWLGIVAACWLHARERLHGGLFLTTLPFLMALSLMSGSRSVYLYTAMTVLWFAGWAWLQQGETRQRLARLALLIAPLLLAVQETIALTGSPVGSAQRLVAMASYESVRLSLWRAAFDIFLAHPILGAGFDTYSRLFFLGIEHTPINGIGIPEHSHNLVTEIAAEFGLAGLALLFLCGGRWLRGLKQQADATSALTLGLLLILGTHSMLEYPLWYAYFLGIAAIAAALADRQTWAFTPERGYGIVLGAAAVGGLIILAGLRSDYLRLEEAAQGRHLDGRAIPADTQRATLAELYAHSLLRPYAALQFAARMPIESRELPARLMVMQEVRHFSPIRQAAYRHAALLELAGRSEEARRQWRLAELAYPSDRPGALQMVREAAAREPALAGLLWELELRDQRSF